jgi:hypothetical protein
VTGQYPTVGVTLPVNLDLAKHGSSTYRLSDEMALRNGDICPAAGRRTPSSAAGSSRPFSSFPARPAGPPFPERSRGSRRTRASRASGR